MSSGDYEMEAEIHRKNHQADRCGTVKGLREGAKHCLAEIVCHARQLERILGELAAMVRTENHDAGSDHGKDSKSG